MAFAYLEDGHKHQKHLSIQPRKLNPYEKKINTNVQSSKEKHNIIKQRHHNNYTKRPEVQLTQVHIQ